MSPRDFDELDDEMQELERELHKELDDYPDGDREDMQRRPHVAYLVLYTAEVEELAEFYEGVFGFTRQYESGSGVDLHGGTLTISIVDEGQLIDTVGLAGVPQVSSARSSHSVLVEDVDSCAAAAVALGGQMIREPHETDWGMRSCWVRDPAGNLVEIGRFVR